MVKILRLLKVNDILAVLEETVADLSLARRDGVFGEKPLTYVVEVFDERVGYCTQNQDLIPAKILDRLKRGLEELKALESNPNPVTGL